jgi:hypothetical protein
MTQQVNTRDLIAEQDNEEWRKPYRAVNGHTMVQRSPRSTWDAVCTADCAACNGTSEYEDEPWYSDGMI